MPNVRVPRVMEGGSREGYTVIDKMARFFTVQGPDALLTEIYGAHSFAAVGTGLTVGAWREGGVRVHRVDALLVLPEGRDPANSSHFVDIESLYLNHVIEVEELFGHDEHRWVPAAEAIDAEEVLGFGFGVDGVSIFHRERESPVDREEHHLSGIHSRIRLGRVLFQAQ